MPLAFDRQRTSKKKSGYVMLHLGRNPYVVLIVRFSLFNYILFTAVVKLP